ncbi:MAG: cyclophilin-like fold protein [Burkholderiales bacterium]
MTPTRIRIAWPRGSVTAVLGDTPSARALLAALPIEAKAQTWGEEVYFEIPIEAALERDAKQVVPPGTVCFWVEGGSLALPWGRTPISQGDQPKLVTRCNVLGKIEGDPGQLSAVRSGDAITVELAP